VFSGIAGPLSATAYGLAVGWLFTRYAPPDLWVIMDILWPAVFLLPWAAGLALANATARRAMLVLSLACVSLYLGASGKNIAEVIVPIISFGIFNFGISYIIFILVARLLHNDAFLGGW